MVPVVVIVPPVVVPPAPPVVAPLDLSGVQAQLDRISANLDNLIASENAFHVSVSDRIKSVTEFLAKYVAPAVSAYFIARKIAN